MRRDDAEVMFARLEDVYEDAMNQDKPRTALEALKVQYALLEQWPDLMESLVCDGCANTDQGPAVGSN